MKNKVKHESIVQQVSRNPDLLEAVLNTPQAQQLLVVQRQEVSSYTGPLPSPEDVVAYAEVIPDFGERVMKYAEKEQATRHAHALGALHLQKLGMYFGMASVVIITVFAFALLYKGDTKAAAWVMGSVLVALVGSFIAGKHLENKK